MVSTAGLSRAMRHLDGIYTQKFNRLHHRDGPLFRGRYKAILIDAEEYFLSVVRYIHHNPLAAGMVTDLDRYRWSSHWGYLNKKQCPTWLQRQAVLSRFDGLKDYQKFIREVEAEIEDFTAAHIKSRCWQQSMIIEKVGEKARVEARSATRQIFGIGSRR
jgi:hypothetical protein